MPKTIDEFEAGQRVRVVQQIPQRDEVWTSHLEGTVVRAEQAKTGSWFARNKDDKLWLDRLVVEKDDGEVVMCTLDAYSHVDLIEPPADESAGEEEVEPDAEEEAAGEDAAAGEDETPDENEKAGDGADGADGAEEASEDG